MQQQQMSSVHSCSIMYGKKNSTKTAARKNIVIKSLSCSIMFAMERLSRVADVPLRNYSLTHSRGMMT